MRKGRSKIALWITAFVLLYITFNMSLWRNKNLLFWDCANYYLFLPATFVYNDLADLKFYPKTVEKYYINNGANDYGLFPQPNGHTVNKYAVGTSVFILPFFLLAHGYCLITDSYPADGYSTPYLVMVIFAILTWVMAGLYVLRKFLVKYFSETATLLTLLLILFATNLYFYTVFNIGMSHPFSFALFCFLLYATDNLYATGKTRYLLWIAAILGVAVITRPTNVIAALVPLLWPYAQAKGLPQRATFFIRKKWGLVASVVLFVSILMLQLTYWKCTAGKWVHFSYEEEHFEFLKPHIIDGLFSYRKGWFLYTPIAFIATLGLVPLLKRYRQLGILIITFLIINIYIVFSWYAWAYGGSFGARSMIDCLPLMAIPLACLIEWIFSRGKALRITAITIFVFCITLNTFQSFQLMNNLTMWDETNKAFYWRTFGKLEVTDEDRKLLPVK